MTKSLKILKDNRDSLLKVELAGWLHDMFKCSDEHVDRQSVEPVLSMNVGKAFYFGFMNDFDISFKGSLKESVRLTELIDKGKPGKTTMEDKNLSLLVKYLGRCHGAAHIEKEEPINGNPKSLYDQIDSKKRKIRKNEESLDGKKRLIDQNRGNLSRLEEEVKRLQEEIPKLNDEVEILEMKRSVYQKLDKTAISSVFGYDYNIAINLTNRLKVLINNNLLDYKDIKAIRELFSEALGDTRRPANEITLEDWSLIVATLFKSAVAGALLETENGKEPVLADKLRWRFLSLRISGEQAFGNSASISDLLARKNWINEGLNRVRTLLEKEYPLGNEVYRDENGSVFVIPDIENILEYVLDDTTETLEKRIRVKLDFRGEITPEIAISEPWWGQKPIIPSGVSPEAWQDGDKTPPIGAIISRQPFSPADPEEISTYWSQSQRNQTCRISWLRPEEDKTRHVSKFWANEIKGRAETWLKEKNTTIWIDEIADSNSKIALVSAKLAISNWIGEEPGKLSLIRTLNYETPPVSKHFEKCAKIPSFARVRRVWETTSKFWDEALAEIKAVINPITERLVLKVRPNNLNLPPNNAYEAKVNEAKVNETKFTVFYENENPKGADELENFVIIENLDLLAKKTEKGSRKDLVDELIKEFKDKNIDFFSSNTPLEVLASSRIDGIEIESCNYSPVIEITKDPERFMVLVPADKALEAAKKIKEKYEKEMGKVRNRLPMNLGIVYAGYHTALPAIMDAGRRLMQINNEEKTRTLMKQPEEFADYFKLYFEDQVWKIPSKMGDCSEDVWYPYFYVDNLDKVEREKRCLSFKGPSGNWLVHVSELKEGDIVQVTPSYFDFEYLSSASQRFEISYTKDGRRRSKDRKHRPYYLDDLDEIERVWVLLSTKLSNSQIKKLNTLVEEKLRDWALSSEKADDTFKSYVENVVDNLRWKQSLSKDEKDTLIDFCVSRKLADVLEIHMSILKDKSEVAE
ncbi:hypothetical protein [Mesotoga sp.]|uniref:hypothetical protein n=1 Tax=Mesotoga sp. TaxID=2053577 RepID=UPI001BD57F34|nr:hypothetical protein [Mesotoga sp.]